MQTIQRVMQYFLVLLLSYSCTAQPGNSLSPDEFEKAITGNKNIQVLDVRTPGEYFSGHIKNALQADWNDKAEFDRRINFVDKEKPVYIYCLAGGRSAAAAEKMRKSGYKQVIELKGGINAWKAADKALEGKNSAPQMTVEAFTASIKVKEPVLVDFGAVWCPPCIQMEPVLTNLKNNKALKFTLLKVDGGNDLDLMKAYQVTALPVFIVFRDGKVVWRKDGIATEKELAEQLK